MIQIFLLQIDPIVAFSFFFHSPVFSLLFANLTPRVLKSPVGYSPFLFGHKESRNQLPNYAEKISLLRLLNPIHTAIISRWSSRFAVTWSTRHEHPVHILVRNHTRLGQVNKGTFEQFGSAAIFLESNLAFFFFSFPFSDMLYMHREWKRFHF